MRLQREFYNRKTIKVAKDLLGKILVLKAKDKLYKAMIVETEAYTNENDDAAHFHKGITHRTRIMEEVGGHLYIYNIYGLYQCLNIVAEKEGVHGGTLIRAVEPIEGIEYMYFNRFKKEFKEPKRAEIINLSNGPAKLVMALAITLDEFYGADLVRDPRIWLEEGKEISPNNIVTTTRINIDYAEKGKDYPFRFYIKDNPHISRK